MRTSLFGTSGIRGKAQELFTQEFCFDLGITFDLFLTRKSLDGPVIVGMDPRGSSPAIKSSLIAGLQSAGREVLDAGTTPVPSICYSLQVIPAAGSVMVSGSHIAADQNGIKFFYKKEEILKPDEEEIDEIYQEIKGKSPYKKGTKPVNSTNAVNETYQDMLVGLTHRQFSNLKIVVDAGNGAQSDTMPQVLTRLGFEVIEKDCSIQAGFIARDTETLDAVASLQKSVIEEKADLGIAYDADGDRVVFVDHTGRFVPGDYTGTMLATKSDGEAIVTPINTSQVIDKIGKKIYRTRVGSPFVISKMKETQSVFGFEANGGGIHANIMYSRDGGSTTIKILDFIAEKGGTLKDIFDSFPRFYQYRTKIDCPRELNETIIEAAKKEYPGRLDETDGLKIWISDTEWILLRPSGNAPEFRVFTESPDVTRADQLGEVAINFVKKIILTR